MAKEGPYRLAKGGEVDRSQTIPFRFNRDIYSGYPGDSLASALLANGIRTVARSFKFHRPRGVFSCGIEEPNALLSLGTGARAIPSVRAPCVRLAASLEAYSQSGWPSVAFDAGRILDLTAPLWAAGFYNKTFIWPSWHTYEGIIRKLAGLGRAPCTPDPDRYEVRNTHCDVLVVGGGVAGICAALEAGRDGKRVLLAEQDSVLGAQAIWDGSRIGTARATEWLGLNKDRLEGMADVKILRCTTAVGYYDHNIVTLLERVVPAEGMPEIRSQADIGPGNTHSRVLPRERYWIVRTDRVVLATGAIEQPLIFDDNDRPGVMLAGAARQYVRRYGVAPGHRALIATNNDSAYALARDLRVAGVNVLGVADSRREVPTPVRELMKSLSIPILPGSIPIDTQGFSGLRRVTVGRLSKDGSHVSSAQTFKCDALAVSGGWNPSLHLFAQAGGKLTYEESSGTLRPVAHHPCIEIVGAAAESVPIGPRVSPVGKTSRQWVDLLHDVTVADLELALREGYASVEHVKRYTTIGMAADQGKTSTAVTLDVIAKLRSISPPELGHTTLRPPFIPVTLGAIAGRDNGDFFAPQRRLPLHDWHVSHGALLQDFGSWQRPVAYLNPGESREHAVHREAFAVRTAAGLFDGSPLGKIEVHGPDALEFVDRFYVNNLQTLKPGRVRYGLMLRETGVIFDDGTIVPLGHDRVLITTTSGNAGRVTAWMEEWHQCEWPDLRVAIVPVTEQWATLSLAGPGARTILSKLDTGIDLSAAAFPHMTLREGRLFGFPARIYRVSFTGELTYEINVPTGAAQCLWQALMEVGTPEGLQPLGMDALLLMRLEKGFLHVGSDTDGTTVPDDVGWGKAAANKTRDYIGKRSLSLPENIRPDRLQLVGLSAIPPSNSPLDVTPVPYGPITGASKGVGTAGPTMPAQRPQPNPPRQDFAIGSHLRLRDSSNPTDGWITSAGQGVLSGDPIALALLRGGRGHIGEEVTVYDAGAAVMRARVVNPPFFDPSGDRMNA